VKVVELADSIRLFRTQARITSALVFFSADVISEYVPALPGLLSVGAAAEVFPVCAVKMMIRSPTAGVATTVFVPDVVLNVAVPRRVTAAMAVGERGGQTSSYRT
jgi:hypothetical protein